jgi:hypothetical protein
MLARLMKKLRFAREASGLPAMEMPFRFTWALS